MTIHKALVSASTDIGKAIKDSTNPHFKSGYASLESVIDTIKPALLKHGLAFIQKIHPGESAAVETLLIHEGGEVMSLGICDVPVDKKSPQGYGSAITYARRYGLVTAFGVPTVDDDGEAVSQSDQVYKYKLETPLTDKQLAYLKSLNAVFDEKEGIWYIASLSAPLEKYCVGTISKEEFKIKQRGIR